MATRRTRPVAPSPVAPVDYPGRMAAQSLLLIDEDEVLPLTLTSGPVEDARVGRDSSARSLADELRALEAAPIAQRQLVLAIGANAVPAVLAAKLRAADGSTVVPMVSCAVRGIEIGHSAHVSPGGYIAAAACRIAESRTTGISALFLDDDQLAAVDRTEPNYERRQVRTGDCPLELDGAAEPDHFALYVSRWGVLADPAGRLIRRTSQADLITQLRAADDELAAWLPADARKATDRLRDPAVAAAVTARFAVAGWARPSGFDLGADPAAHAIKHAIEHAIKPAHRASTNEA